MVREFCRKRIGGPKWRALFNIPSLEITKSSHNKNFESCVKIAKIRTTCSGGAEIHFPDYNAETNATSPPIHPPNPSASLTRCNCFHLSINVAARSWTNAVDLGTWSLSSNERSLTMPMSSSLMGIIANIVYGATVKDMAAALRRSFRSEEEEHNVAAVVNEMAETMVEMLK